VIKARGELLQQMKLEPSTVATIMMNNSLEELKVVSTGSSRADTLHRVLSLGWEYLNAVDEQRLFSVLRPDADITKAMALSVMNAKLFHRQYASLDAFSEDVLLMLKNHAALSPAPDDVMV